MAKVNLPTETAHEPTEEAHQPEGENAMSRPLDGSKVNNQKITFAEDTQSSEITSSQCNSSYKDVLSQPGPGLSHRQRLLWVQKRRKPGLWVQCDECDKWRYLPHIVAKHELPEKWYCRLNIDRNESDCSVAETPIHLREEEDMIHSEYSAGSVVWARFGGWPWWPAMVDDCPDTEQFYWLDGLSDIPTYYNVVFFDSNEVSRAWITPRNLKPYSANKKALKNLMKNKKYRKRLDVAISQADDADMLPFSNRLAKYSFIARYRGTVGSPKKITKLEYEKFKNKLKRKLDIDFSDESDSENELSMQRRQETRNKNIILVGTPKRAKKAKRSVKDVSNKVIEIPDTPIQDSLIKDTHQVSVQNNELFKEPDSMAVQLGSTSVNGTMAIDNDSSKTYLPENDKAHIDIEDTPETETEFQIRIATPSSDDFEF